MSEIEMLGLGGVAVIAIYLLVRAFLSKSRQEDDATLAGAEGESAAE